MRILAKVGIISVILNILRLQSNRFSFSFFSIYNRYNENDREQIIKKNFPEIFLVRHHELSIFLVILFFDLI